MKFEEAKELNFYLYKKHDDNRMWSLLPHHYSILVGRPYTVSEKSNKACNAILLIRAKALHRRMPCAMDRHLGKPSKGVQLNMFRLLGRQEPSRQSHIKIEE